MRRSKHIPLLLAAAAVVIASALVPCELAHAAPFPAPFPADATVNTGNLNVRAGPGVEYQVLGAFPGGTQLRILDRNNGSSWIKIQVESDGTTGWVNRSYILETKSGFTQQAGSAASADDPVMITGFETWGTWLRGDEMWGSFERSSAQSSGGTYSGKITYDFPKGTKNNYLVFMRRLPMPANTGKLRIRVFGDGSRNYLNAWVADANGELWQFTFGRIEHTGWKSMTANLDLSKGWPNEGISPGATGEPTYPLQFYALVLDGHTTDRRLKGEVYVDRLMAIPSSVYPVTQTVQPRKTPQAEPRVSQPNVRPVTPRVVDDNPDKDDATPDNEYTIVVTGDPKYSVAAVRENGEMLIALTDTDSQGRVHRVEGGVWHGPDGKNMTVLFGNDGLPERALYGGRMFLFSNYTANTVDVAVALPNGTFRIERGLAVDPDLISEMRELSHLGSKLAADPSMLLGATTFTWRQTIKMVSLGLSIVGCGLAIFFTVGTSFPCLAVVAWIATEAFAKTEESEVVGLGAQIGLNAIGCAYDALSCVSLVIDTGGEAFGQFSNALDKPAFSIDFDVFAETDDNSDKKPNPVQTETSGDSDSFYVRGELVDGVTVQGRLVDNKTHFWKFDGVAGRDVSLQVRPLNDDVDIGFTIQILRPGGTTESAPYHLPDGSAIWGRELLESGTYLVQVGVLGESSVDKPEYALMLSRK